MKHAGMMINFAPRGAKERDRDERFRMALEAGWTLDQLWALARENKLPSRGAILCKRWWKVTGEQLAMSHNERSET